MTYLVSFKHKVKFPAVKFDYQPFHPAFTIAFSYTHIHTDLMRLQGTSLHELVVILKGLGANRSNVNYKLSQFKENTDCN